MATGNPNHPVVRQLETEWHKIVAVILCDLGRTEYQITPEMISRFAEMYPDGAVVADCRQDRFVLRLVDNDEAERLARKEGGLPS